MRHRRHCDILGTYRAFLSLFPQQLGGEFLTFFEQVFDHQVGLPDFLVGAHQQFFDITDVDIEILGNIVRIPACGGRSLAAGGRDRDAIR